MCSCDLASLKLALPRNSARHHLPKKDRAIFNGFAAATPLENPRLETAIARLWPVSPRHQFQPHSVIMRLTLCETSLGLTPREKFVFSRWFLVEIASSELFWCAAPAHLPRSRPASAESRRAWHGPGRLPSPPVARAPAEPQSWGDCGTLIRAGGAAQHAGKSFPGSAHARKARPHRPCMASNRSAHTQNS